MTEGNANSFLHSHNSGVPIDGYEVKIHLLCDDYQGSLQVRYMLHPGVGDTCDAHEWSWKS